MSKHLIAFLFMLGSCQTFSQAAQPASLQAATFDGPAQSCIERRLLNRPSTTVGPFGREGRGVRVDYVGNEQGSGRIVFRCPLPHPGLEYTLSYDVRFGKDFQFVRGGKLHGLGPEHVMSGGGGTAADGWSARVVFHKEGGIGTYVYNQAQEGKYGMADWADGFRFVPDQYHRVTLHVLINSAPDLSDGSVRLYVDGKKLIERIGIRYRGVGGDQALITSVLFSTFHGGGDPTWSPKDSQGHFTTVHADFDNFEVHAGPPAFDRSGQAPSAKSLGQKQR